jgi:hypothetical protein
MYQMYYCSQYSTVCVLVTSMMCKLDLVQVPVDPMYVRSFVDRKSKLIRW